MDYITVLRFESLGMINDSDKATIIIMQGRELQPY